MTEEQTETQAPAPARRLENLHGNTLSVRELYSDIDNSWRFASAMAWQQGDNSEQGIKRVFSQIITGAELGIPPAASVRGITFIKGNITMRADLMVALAREEGWKFQIEHSDPPGEWCRVTASKDDESYSFTWQFDMAKKAGLTGGHNWQNYPWDMLYARAASHVARKVAPGRLLGMYAPEEMGADERNAFHPQQSRQYQSAETDPLLNDHDDESETPDTAEKQTNA